MSTFREEDDKEQLTGFALWLLEHGWIVEPHEKLMWLVDEFLKEREDARAWGKRDSSD